MRSICLRMYGTTVVLFAAYIDGNLGTPVVVGRLGNFKSRVSD